MVIKENRRVLQRDGKQFCVGFWGDGLTQAVEGNQRALRAANAYRWRTRVGHLLGFMSMAGAIAAGYWGVDQLRSDPEASLLGPEILLLTSVSVLGLEQVWLRPSAEAYFWDAVSIYNDSISE